MFDKGPDKTGTNFQIKKNIRRKLFVIVLYMIFQCGSEPVLIRRILIGFEAYWKEYDLKISLIFVNACSVHKVFHQFKFCDVKK